MPSVPSGFRETGGAPCGTAPAIVVSQRRVARAWIGVDAVQAIDFVIGRVGVIGWIASERRARLVFVRILRNREAQVAVDLAAQPQPRGVERGLAGPLRELEPRGLAGVRLVPCERSGVRHEHPDVVGVDRLEVVRDLAVQRGRHGTPYIGAPQRGDAQLLSIADCEGRAGEQIREEHGAHDHRTLHRESPGVTRIHVHGQNPIRSPRRIRRGFANRVWFCWARE
jgi:hypothetical protein